MRQLEAMEATLNHARDRGMAMLESATEGVDYKHLISMYVRAEAGNFSEAKLGRWLGWMQGVIVALGFGTLEEMKRINMEHQDDK